MRTLILILFIPLVIHPLYGSRNVPKEIIEFLDSRKNLKVNFNAFKEEVQETQKNMRSLELFIKRDQLEVCTHLDMSEEDQTKRVLMHLVKILSSQETAELHRNDDVVRKEIKPFYRVHLKPSPPSTTVTCQASVDESTLSQNQTLNFETARLFYIYSKEASSMLTRLEVIEQAHVRMKRHGALISATTRQDERLILTPILEKFLLHAVKLFWWGEMLRMRNYKEITLPERKNWEQDNSVWIGSKTPSHHTIPDESENGLSKTFTRQLIKTMNAAFVHQMMGYAAHGWSIGDLQEVFPDCAEPLKHFALLTPTHSSKNHIPYISLHHRLDDYAEHRDHRSKGIYAYPDPDNLLQTINTYLETGHAHKIDGLKAEALRLAEKHGLSIALANFQTEVKGDVRKKSENIFELTHIHEREHRFETFDPMSLSNSLREGSERREQILALVNDEEIAGQLLTSPLLNALAHRNLLSKIFDIVVDSWTESFRTPKLEAMTTDIQQVFRKLHVAIQTADTGLVEHLFLFTKIHPNLTVNLEKSLSV